MLRLLTLLLLTFSASLEAQNYQARFFDVKDGLISDICYTVFQDSQGFIWVGTNAGVSRYNGTEFINFDQDDGLPAYSVYQIYEDSQGRIWFLTDTGTSVFYQNGKFHNPENTPYLKEMSTESYRYGFLEDKLGQIWIGSFNNGIRVLKPDKKVFIDEDESSFSGRNRTLQFYQHNDDEVLSINANSIFCYDINSLKIKWTEQIFTESASVIRTAKLSESIIFIQSQSERLWFDVGTRKVLKRAGVEPIIEFIFFSENIENVHYVGSRDGLFELKEYDISPSNRFSDLKGKAISTVIKDNNGNFWASTLKSGLVKLSDYPFVFDNARQGLYLKRFFASGNVFEGYFNGSHKFIKKGGKTQTIKNYVPPNSRPLEAIELTEKQYIVFNENYVTYYENGQSFQRPFAAKAVIYDKENGEMLVGQSRGISRIQAENFIRDLKSKDITQFGLSISINTGVEEYTNCILPVNGGFLVGTRSGLFRVTNKKAEKLSIPHEIEDLNIMKILPQANGNIYLISYGKGVFDVNLETKTFRQISEKDGLSNNYLHNAIIDRDSTLWVLTKLGVSQIKNNDNGFEILNYGENEGLMNTYIQFLYEEGGLLKFCSLDGEYITNTFDLQAYHQKKPKVFLSKIEGFDNSQRDFKVGRNLYFQFETLSLEFGDDLSTVYRIIEGDKRTEWFPFKKRLPVNASEKANLILQVRAITRENLSSEILEIPISIRPEWYRSDWFSLLIIGLFSLMVFYLFKKGTLKLESESLIKTWEKLRNLKDLQLGQTQMIIKATDGSFVKLPESQIYRISASGNYAEYITQNGKFLSRITMKELEKELSHSSKLKRIHRSHFVNTDHIEKVYQNNLLVQGDEIPVGHKYADLLIDLKGKVKILK
ncbi:ligand-binding sensor domain-containing protein [Jiulongibacter sediminis]|uniref:HTH LytTR-type domain-containing protein n=1 Tax=Jiulongibacter sediminis TaxID=1605367 RepID=A0A0P7C3G0_9BACT|nr:LytTR family DNA-binding domain-containing protein [Jiulongibacter sediminis]KPM49174.1 hypothetical protein AFM12_00565 [Jiulongibacter sediminis]TBX26228.1 hypothetical protein TK44_00565 [Jiulongibacter sediminis]